MKAVDGIRGYERAIDEFIEACEAVNFAALHRPYLHLLPSAPARILDVGAGSGRDAAALAAMGHRVVAIEPMPGFLDRARQLHDSPAIQWLEDCLPELRSLDFLHYQFDVILVMAVWHHLDDVQRTLAMMRLAELTREGGVLVLSLRNGPPGIGVHSFPTSVEQCTKLARVHGFDILQQLVDQPGLLPGKGRVTWSRLVLQRNRKSTYQ